MSISLDFVKGSFGLWVRGHSPALREGSPHGSTEGPLRMSVLNDRKSFFREVSVALLKVCESAETSSMC